MNFKKSALASAITLATFATGAAAFDASSWEVSGFVKNETAAFQSSGQTVGYYQHKTTSDPSNLVGGGDVFKNENTLKLFVNGDISPNLAAHAEVNLNIDFEGYTSDYASHAENTQSDFLRELYLDTSIGDGVEVRLGKQQVVWGTADGIKLLDIINPTDYREFAQNTMEDSRIPVWMIKADMTLGDDSSVQFVLSQAEENKIPGLTSIAAGVRDSATNQAIDQGHPFIMKGVDTIFGKYNGFLNIAPDMGQFAANMGGFAAALAASHGTTNWQRTPFSTIFADGWYSSFVGFSQTTLAQDSAIMNANGYSPTAPRAVFDLMGGTTAATMTGFSGIKSEYRKKLPSNTDANYGLRFKGATDQGFNYSLNYLDGYDPNPSVTIHWEDASGNTLTPTTTYLGASGDAGTSTNGSGGYYVALSGTADRLVFEEKLNRVQNFGASFDATIDSDELPVVLRGEFLYQKDVLSPVVDKGKLYVGDLAGALTMQEGDWFKYVIGADINVLTNMLVSAQFIQFVNLDYVDELSTAVDGSKGLIYQSHKRYTADPATMHITNGLQQGKETKEFYSLFLSKPFGANQLGRWNDIFIFEEGGGYWNRFDVEYSFSDELIGSFELNNYWGDANTQFGQMEDSSNIQVGLKYLF